MPKKNHEHDDTPHYEHEDLPPEMFWESIGKDDRQTDPVNLEEHIDPKFFEQPPDPEPEDPEPTEDPD